MCLPVFALFRIPDIVNISDFYDSGMTIQIKLAKQS